MRSRRHTGVLDEAGVGGESAALLTSSFNPATPPSLTCLTEVSVTWNGRLYDRDFNRLRSRDSWSHAGWML